MATRPIVGEGLLAAGVPLVSMQVQYSLIDTRPAKEMTALAKAHGFQFLCYGSVSGGLFSERWLGAAGEGEFKPGLSSVLYFKVADIIAAHAERRARGANPNFFPRPCHFFADFRPPARSSSLCRPRFRLNRTRS